MSDKVIQIKDVNDNVLPISNDSASNYCKMPDGTLIQWGVFTSTASNNRAWGNLYVADFADISFAVPFISRPSFTISPNSGNSAEICSCTLSETGVTGIQAMRGTAFGTSYIFGWQAIGRWK